MSDSESTTNSDILKPTDLNMEAGYDHRAASSEPSSTPIVFAASGAIRANSTDIAVAFGKAHRSVLRAIDDLIAAEPNLRLRNFVQTVVARCNPSGGRSIESRAFEMDRDGFALLAMGFTGPKALRWKLAYIDAFNRMEQALHSQDGNLVRLDASGMNAIGGMVKGILLKFERETLPEMIRAEMASHRYQLVEAVSAIEVAKLAGYPEGKRPRGLAQFISHQLTLIHQVRGIAIKRLPHDNYRTKLFDEAVSREWLGGGGRELVDRYVSTRRGQSNLRLIGGKMHRKKVATDET